MRKILWAFVAFHNLTTISLSVGTYP